jgi:hypothetical protein
MKNKSPRGKKNGKTQVLINLQQLTAILNLSPRPFLYDINETSFSTRPILTPYGFKAIQKAVLN